MSEKKIEKNSLLLNLTNRFKTTFWKQLLLFLNACIILQILRNYINARK